MTAKKTAFTLKITNPDGQARVIPVKPSTLVTLEELTGIPVWERVRQGFTASFTRIGYLVGRDAGFIPADLTFEALIDGDAVWQFEIDSEDPEVTDAEGNA